MTEQRITYETIPGVPPPPISTSEIVGGIKRGIIPDKPGMYFNFFKEALTEADENIKRFRAMMYEKYALTRKEYLEIIPPGPEKKLARELGDRAVRLFDLAHRHLMTQELLVPEKEREKYRGQWIPVGMTADEWRKYLQGEWLPHERTPEELLRRQMER